jgi:multiple sugar transport system permease protein
MKNNISINLTKKDKIGLLLIAPLLIWLTIVLLYPFVYVIFLSFFRRDPGTSIYEFRGFSYFYNLLFRDDIFWQSLLRSFRWTSINVILQFIFGILTALLLKQKLRGMSLVRLWVILPWITPIAVVVLVWRWMLNPSIGIVEVLLRQFGFIEGYLNVLANADTVMNAIIGIHSWRFFPFVAVIILGRMLGIPEELYDAAKVDGASSFQSFLYITLPQLRGVMLTFLMLATVWTFTSFDTIFLMTGGGPVNLTTTLPILVYRKAFQTYQLNEGAALSLIMFLFSAIFMAIYVKLGVERND